MDAIMNLFREAWRYVAGLWYWNRRGARYVIIAGGPGSGKDTVAKKLSAKLGLPILSTGDVLRLHISQGTDIGKQFEKLVNAGQLVPDTLVMKLVKTELKKPEYFQGAILNGIPRTKQQAELLRRMLAWWGNKVSRVVCLDGQDDDLVARISNRRICTNEDCRQVFHTIFSPPKVENVCDACKSTLFIRKDDKEEVVRERLRLHHINFQPVKEFYERHRLLTVVPTNNVLTPDQVFTNVLFAIEQFD